MDDRYCCVSVFTKVVADGQTTAYTRFIQSEQFLKVHAHAFKYRIGCRFESQDNDTVRWNTMKESQKLYDYLTVACFYDKPSP